jgi:ribonuclease HII
LSFPRKACPHESGGGNSNKFQAPNLKIQTDGEFWVWGLYFVVWGLFGVCILWFGFYLRFVVWGLRFMGYHFYLYKMKEFKLLPFKEQFRLEAGCDEAGRGCLAGPVFAAAVILPQDFFHAVLNDSKQLSHNQREILRPIIEQSALAWAVGRVEPEEIDEINILNASFLAMHRAISELKIKPEFLLIDGPRFNPYPGISHNCEIRGDGRFMSIAAASVLAKTYRDDYMLTIHQDYPQYHWDHNKGYPTRQHRAAIQATGACIYHRKSFRLLDGQLEIAGF